MQTSNWHAALPSAQNWLAAHVWTSVDVAPLGPHFCTLPPLQKYASGVQIFGRQVPLRHALPDAAQSVPPATKPEPSALHVVARAPLQASPFGMHFWGVQAGDGPVESQYAVAPHVLKTDSLPPLPWHW